MPPETLLAFEASWPRHNGPKEERIPRELGVTSARFYQLLNRAARSLEGVAADPIMARRVQDRARA